MNDFLKRVAAQREAEREADMTSRPGKSLTFEPSGRAKGYTWERTESILARLKASPGEWLVIGRTLSPQAEWKLAKRLRELGCEAKNGGTFWVARWPR